MLIALLFHSCILLAAQVISIVGQLASEVEQEESIDQVTNCAFPTTMPTNDCVLPQFDDDISKIGRARPDQLGNG